jgi:predicted glycoside hydrolase/deacetylase ChbG (UPF0249 family)
VIGDEGTAAGEAAGKRYLIVNADDFGLSPGVNRGIVEAFERGIVTSASLMVRAPAAAEAATQGRARPDLGLGLHVDLAEWRYADGGWRLVYQVVPLDDPGAVGDEVARQLEAFRRLVGRDPTHLDSHQHLHREEPLRSRLLELAAELGVTLRHLAADVRYCGHFYGQTGRGERWADGITAERLIEIVAGLAPGVTELACHPGYADALDSPYRAERAQELRALTDPRVRAALVAKGVQLRSFRDLGSGARAAG